MFFSFNNHIIKILWKHEFVYLNVKSPQTEKYAERIIYPLKISKPLVFLRIDKLFRISIETM